MHEMRAEPIPAEGGRDPAAFWHVVPKNGWTALCGRRLTEETAVRPVDNDGPEKYCSSCLTAFRETVTPAAG